MSTYPFDADLVTFILPDHIKVDSKHPLYVIADGVYIDEYYQVHESYKPGATRRIVVHGPAHVTIHDWDCEDENTITRPTTICGLPFVVWHANPPSDV